MPQWVVPATVVAVYDGDTVHLDLDLGWNITYHARVRLLHINAPELHTAEGVAAKQFAQTLLKPGDPVVFTSHRLDKYGRPLGTITYGGFASKDFATEMLLHGHAVEQN